MGKLRIALGALCGAHVAWQQQTSPLFVAAQNGDTAAVKRLLAAGAPVDLGSRRGPFGCSESATPLFIAAQNGHAATASALLAAGASFDACAGGATEGPMGLLLSITPLSVAVVGGHADVAKALLAAGADADEGVTVGPLGVLRAWTPTFAAGDCFSWTVETISGFTALELEAEWQTV